MITECQNANQECPLYKLRPPKELARTQEHGCFADRDHVFPRHLARVAFFEPDKVDYPRRYLVRYIRDPHNLQQLCRNEHNEKSARELVERPEYPTREQIQQALFETFLARRGLSRKVEERGAA